MEKFKLTTFKLCSQIPGLPQDKQPRNDESNPLYPCNIAEFYLDIERKCPFCGKILNTLECDCDPFKMAFLKLQESFGDKDHCSHLQKLHGGIYVVIRPENVVKLTDTEVVQLGDDFFDELEKLKIGQNWYYITEPEYEDGNIHFYYKDIVSNEVYRCDIKVNPKDDSFLSLETLVDQSSAITCRLMNQPIGGFTGWKNFCEKLLSMK